MKKITILVAVMLLALSASAFADGTPLPSNEITSAPADAASIYGGVDAADAARADGVLIGKTSKGVKFRAAYSIMGFAAATKHLSGTKAYGTAHNSTAIRFSDLGTGEIPSLASPDNGAFTATWTAM